MQRALWLVAVLAVAQAAPDAGAAEDSEADVVEKTCAGCHAPAQLDALVRAGTNDGAAPQALDAFLASHHVPDPLQRARLVDYLLSRVERAKH